MCILGFEEEKAGTIVTIQETYFCACCGKKILKKRGVRFIKETKIKNSTKINGQFVACDSPICAGDTITIVGEITMEGGLLIYKEPYKLKIRMPYV